MQCGLKVRDGKIITEVKLSHTTGKKSNELKHFEVKTNPNIHLAGKGPTMQPRYHAMSQHVCTFSFTKCPFVAYIRIGTQGKA